MVADVLGFLWRAQSLGANRTAVTYPSGHISYGELLSRVQAVARRLPQTGGDSGELVAVIAEHDIEVPELYLGVMASGHAVVPISSRLPLAAIERVLDSGKIRAALLAPSAASRFEELVSSNADVRWMTTQVGYAGDLASRPSVVPPGTAMVCFTSGTTGEPKGVLLSHVNLIAHALVSLGTYRVGREAVHVNPMPLAHFAGASRVILAVANAGNHVILPEFDAEAVLAAVQRWSGTHMMVVPTMAADLLRAADARTDISSLQTLVYGAAPMPMNLARALADRMQCGLVNGYGLTESSALATALGPEEHRMAMRTDDDELLGTVGAPVPGVELAILGADLKPVPQGDVGEIALRGLKISPGYFLNPQATEEKHLPEGWLRSGDQGQVDDRGNLRLLGRLDDMMITGGVNVQPTEVENAAREFAGVGACAAFAVPSERWGQEVRLAVVADDAALDESELRQFLLSRLDKYKVPRTIHLIRELPVTSVGKVQRFRLSEMAASGELDGGRS